MVIKSNINSRLNQLASSFKEKESRKMIVSEFRDSESCFFGENEYGEDIELHISDDELLLKTYQQNGSVRNDYFDANGTSTGTTFDGRWK